MTNELILIACSGGKVHGGEKVYKPVSPWEQNLEERNLNNLRNARGKIKELLNLMNDPKIGINAESRGLYLPAYLRYNGTLYRESVFADSYQSIPCNKKIIIVSALLGLIEPSDLIEDYQLMMGCDLPNGRPVYHFWKTHEISSILTDYINKNEISIIHNLLSTDYRKVFNWPLLRKETIDIIPYDFPKAGRQSNVPRGKKLKEVMIT